MLWNRLGRHADVGLLITRLGFGLGFIYYHGGPKLFESTEEWIETGSAMHHFGITFGYYYRKRLNKVYGKGRWRKLRGFAAVRLSDGTIHQAEVHWYEAHGIGRRDMKLKLPLLDRAL